MSTLFDESEAKLRMATEVLVPPLGTTMDTVTLVKWYVDEGGMVRKGEPLFAIETDKATLDVEAPDSGILRQVTARPGDVLPALSVIAVIAAPDEILAETAAATSPVVQTSPLTSAPEAEPARVTAAGERRARILISPRARRLAERHHIPLAELRGSGPNGAILERDVLAYGQRSATPTITPVAQRMAEQAGVDWQRLQGSGVAGRITRADVERAIAGPSETAQLVTTSATDNTPIEVIPLQGVRAVIAERMARSHSTTAPVTLTALADATALVALRQQLQQDGINVSYNDLFIYIAARALREHRRLNASLEGEAIKVWQRIHIGLAVDTERGLLVPVIRDADTKGLAQLAQETSTLIARAQAGQSTPAELTGSTFTITNLGMFGIDSFTPVINLPECAILGIGRINRQAVAMGEEIAVRQMVWLSLSFDHRLVDGAPAARFLRRVMQLVEGPHLLMA
ncbi:MAG: 2-oxo acid dehydrogenase subunit E2 [Ardenticatenia bacterium]|jgi:pyruvate dehydrogenase E2 component (dihydrolipoamide acetyltransferase)|nr:MAG: 2-oxo acid dehydrogenase subunit E2 [Ardenticatenia bacterium]